MSSDHVKTQGPNCERRKLCLQHHEVVVAYTVHLSHDIKFKHLVAWCHPRSNVSILLQQGCVFCKGKA